MADPKKTIQEEKIARAERRQNQIRKILSGKQALADFDAADIKRLTILIALILVDGDEGEV